MASQPQKIPAVMAHGRIRQVFEDVFVVRGTAKMGPGFLIPRNMTVVRHDGDLTLICAVRLDDAGLAELEKLGRIRNVLKLGALHQMDDAFYVNKYSARYWVSAAEKPSKLNNVTVDVQLNEGTPLPFPGTFVPLGFKLPEAVIVMPRHSLLITCDAIQNWTSTDGCSFIGATMTKVLGFMDRPCNIGPGLVTLNKRKPGYTGPTLWEVYQQVNKLEWTNMLTAHGEPVTDGSAHASKDPIAASFRRLGIKAALTAVVLIGGAFAAWMQFG